MSCAIPLRAPPCGVFGLPTVCSDSDFADVGIHGAVDTIAHLGWLPHPDTSVMGYNVNVGPTLDAATTLVSILLVVSQALNALAPSVEYNVLLDLGSDLEITCASDSGRITAIVFRGGCRQYAPRYSGCIRLVFVIKRLGKTS